MLETKRRNECANEVRRKRLRSNVEGDCTVANLKYAVPLVVEHVCDDSKPIQPKLFDTMPTRDFGDWWLVQSKGELVKMASLLRDLLSKVAHRSISISLPLLLDSEARSVTGNCTVADLHWAVTSKQEWVDLLRHLRVNPVYLRAFQRVALNKFGLTVEKHRVLLQAGEVHEFHSPFHIMIKPSEPYEICVLTLTPLALASSTESTTP